MNAKNKNTRKFLSFDLSTDALKKYYPSITPWGYKRAYAKIQKYLTLNGFQHIQGSSYVSKEKMDDYDAICIVAQICIEYDWIEKCKKSITITNFDENSDVTYIAENPKAVIEILKRQPTAERKSLEETLAAVSKIRDEINQRENTKSLKPNRNDIEI